MSSIPKKADGPNPITKELLLSLRQMIRPHARNSHDTDDILQDVLVKVVKNGKSVAPAKFLPWLQRVAKTTSIDFYRKNKSNSVELDEEKHGMPISDVDSDPLLAKCVRPLIQKLSPSDSKILLAIDLNEESQTELARKRGLKYSALKSKVQRARQKLKDEILECCRVALDSRRRPMDVTDRKKANCC